MSFTRVRAIRNLRMGDLSDDGMRQSYLGGRLPRRPAASVRAGLPPSISQNAFLESNAIRAKMCCADFVHWAKRVRRGQAGTPGQCQHGETSKQPPIQQAASSMRNGQHHAPPYVIGIDAGTEAVKAGLFDASGVKVASATYPYQTSFPHPGWAEQNPGEWWSGLVHAVRECLSRSRIAVEQVAGIGAVATTCTLVAMRGDGTVLRPAILWMDVRAAVQAAGISATEHEALRYCPAGVNAEWMPPKALWFKTEQPQLYAQTDYLLEYADWIAYKLTGSVILNVNTVTQRWFYRSLGEAWPSDFYAAIGLEGIEAKFPRRVADVGEPIGALAPDAADELGLRPGIPVATGGGDAFVGLLGQDVTEPGEMGLITGSSNVLSALSASEFAAPGIFGSFPDALIPGLHLIEAGQVSTGSVLSWFRRNFARDLESEAAGRGLSPYQLLDQEAATVPIGSEGLVALDYFQGNRTPHTDASARGAIWGLSLQSSRAHVFRALMEGIAYGLRDILDTLERSGFATERLIASGGATHSKLFMQIYADVLGIPLHTTREPEASMLGAAVSAAVGAQIYPNLQEAAKSMVSIAGTYHPNGSNHAQYAFYLRNYQETYRRLQDLMQQMSQHLFQQNALKPDAEK